MSYKKSSVPAVEEVISLLSSDDEDDYHQAEKKSAVPAVPAAEVISLLSSDDKSNDKTPQSMVGQVATYPTTPTTPHVAGLVQRDPPVNAAGAAAGDVYWIDPTRTPEIEYDQSGSGATVMVLFTVEGKPSPLKTARFKWITRFGRPQVSTYNPSAELQASFQKVVKDARYFPVVPVFPDQKVYARLVCWIRRPDNHFIASNRGPGRVQARFQDQMAFLPQNRLDVDNLAKFVLDAMKGLLYTDDSQVVTLKSVKLHDNIGSCNGRTELQVWRVRPEDLPLIVQSPYHLFR
jgi:hypothetical protein